MSATSMAASLLCTHFCMAAMLLPLATDIAAAKETTTVYGTQSQYCSNNKNSAASQCRTLTETVGAKSCT